MIINGKERKFFLTVGASCAIAELCPDGDIAKIGELFRGRYSKNMTSVAKFIAAMNRGYEERIHGRRNGARAYGSHDGGIPSCGERSDRGVYDRQQDHDRNRRAEGLKKKQRGRRRKLTKAWLLFYGIHEFGMTREQVLTYPYGEFIDLISCLSIYNGGAEEKNKLSFDEVLARMT